MSDWKVGLAGLALTTMSFASAGARPAEAAVVVIHDGPREAPPPPREERVIVRPGYSWNAGHYEWRHHRYVWVHGRHIRERRGYDWYRGEWHPHR